MKKWFGLLLILLALASCKKENELFIDLSGEWHVSLDRDDKGITEEWYATRFTETIILPGSLVENGMGDAVSVNTIWTSQIVDSSWYTADKYAPYRVEGNTKIPFWLQPEKRYAGAAWYQKEIVVPGSWNNKLIVLHLERPHWETRLWIDDMEIGMQNSLGTPHSYQLKGPLDPEKHLLTIRVDNRIKEVNPGVNAHSISDHTQSNWNGIVGDISLQAIPLIFIENVKLFPDVEHASVTAEIHVRNLTGKARPCTIKLLGIPQGKADKLEALVHEFSLKEGDDGEILELSYPMGTSPALWDEFNPNLYRMELELLSPEGRQEKQLVFGMREFKAEGKRFTINGRPLFLRGSLECSIFPKTGYPPTDSDHWLKIFKSARAHGLNHIRFHSWCPPEAAFVAADELGIYLQVECSSWVNSGPTVGDGQPIDTWLYKEAEYILKAYGNHPSFCLMAHGN
ncbi:MAG: beta-galactosidase, partial [Bacteroidota bacterium]|nr:beta-galactosidase [Bacteroidota bacterium]